MGDIVKFCDKTTLEVEANIETTSNLLSLEIKGDELKTVKTTIESNYENQKRNLNAGKTKKFRQLKFYPNRSTARNFDNNDDNNKKTYSQVVKPTQLGNNRQKVVSPRNSSTNLAKKNSNIHLSGTGNIQRKTSKMQIQTNNRNTNGDQRQKQIENLQHQINNLRNSQSKPKQQDNSKNAVSLLREAPTSQKSEISPTQVLDFITKTMETLAEFKQHFNNLQSTPQILMEM